jgi:hypothetical protein
MSKYKTMQDVRFPVLVLCQPCLDGQRTERRVRFGQQVVGGIKLGNLQKFYYISLQTKPRSTYPARIKDQDAARVHDRI